MAFGATAEVKVLDGYSVLVNHERETDLVLDVAQELFGRGHVKMKLAPSMGGEDFSFFTEKVPGAFYHIGCSPIDRMPAPALHSQHFCADERCIHQGLMMQMGIVLTETGTEL